MAIALLALSRRAKPVAAYLFGSRAEGKAGPWSDYDLAVFIDGVENWDFIGIARLCAVIQKEAGDYIELHVFPAKALVSPEPASFAAFVIRHGIRLKTDEAA